MEELFDVWQIFTDGSREKVRDKVIAEEAVKASQHYSNNVTAKMGITKEVIIVDMGDCTNFHWIYGEGVVFPTSNK